MTIIKNFKFKDNGYIINGEHISYDEVVVSIHIYDFGRKYKVEFFIMNPDEKNYQTKILSFGGMFRIFETVSDKIHYYIDDKYLGSYDKNLDHIDNNIVKLFVKTCTQKK